MSDNYLYLFIFSCLTERRSCNLLQFRGNYKVESFFALKKICFFSFNVLSQFLERISESAAISSYQQVTRASPLDLLFLSLIPFNTTGTEAGRIILTLLVNNNSNKVINIVFHIIKPSFKHHIKITVHTTIISVSSSWVLTCLRINL